MSEFFESETVRNEMQDIQEMQKELMPKGRSFLDD